MILIAIPAVVCVMMFAIAIGFVAAIAAPRKRCTKRRCARWPRRCQPCRSRVERDDAQGRVVR